MAARKKIAHNSKSVKSVASGSRNLKNKSNENPRLVNKAPKKKKMDTSSPSSSKINLPEKGTKIVKMKAKVKTTVQKSSSNSSSDSSCALKPQKKPSKSKANLLPTRPPSARRREKLERQLAILHGLQVPTPDDTDEADEKSENTDDTDQKSSIEADTEEIEEEICGEVIEERVQVIDEQEVKVSPEMAPAETEKITVTTEVQMETEDVKDPEAETCEIARQLAALEVESAPPDNVVSNMKESSENVEGMEQVAGDPVEETCPEVTVECVTEDTIPINDDNQQVVIQEVIVDSLEESFEEEIPSNTDEIQNFEEIIGFGHSDVTLAKNTEEQRSTVVSEETKLEPFQSQGEPDSNLEVCNAIVDSEQVSEPDTNLKSDARKKPIKEPKQTKGIKPSQIPKKDDNSKSAKKENKKKPVADKKAAMTSEEVRRSSRIKIISGMKKTSQGRGLVRQKSDLDNSENSNSCSNDTEKSTPSDSPKSVIEPEVKPPRTRTRWQKIEETNVNVETLQNAMAAQNMLGSNNNNNNNNENDEAKKARDDAEVESRLKQFVHLKENQYKTDRMTCKEAKKMVCDCFLTAEEAGRGELACGEDCLNRLLLIECGNLCPVNDRCTNKRFQKGQFAPVEVFRTDKKGLGLRAAANIPYGEFILEYVGEVLNPDEFEKRAEHYSKDKNLHYYFMSLRADAVIDATQKGNISRFINHSCDPNAETQKWTVNGELRIGFFSTRTILAGEEVTFDYRFQRYGKEAQKCYCEAPTCRGWLGEEPEEYEDEEYEDEEEEEEEEEEEDIIEDEEEEEPMPGVTATEEAPKIEPAAVTVSEHQETIDVTSTEDNLISVPKSETYTIGLKDIVKEVSETLVSPAVVPPIPTMPIKKEKKLKVYKKKPRKKELFEELDQLDSEIDLLLTTGLKNQAHTLKLSRLIVRAKEPALRTKLLRILRRGELPCRRLFLDYHGLRLIHGYMIDAQHLAKTNKKLQSLKLELLQTLATLPIQNKTMLQDSKVLPTVENWSHPEKGDISPEDSESNSPNTPPEATQTPPDSQSPKVSSEKKSDTPIKEEIQETQEVSNGDLEIRKSVGMDVRYRIKNVNFKNVSGKDLADEISLIFDEDTPMDDVKQMIPIEQEPPLPNYEEEIVALALKLLEEWANLKEAFRIPKKERIEQMKLHEREANKGFITGLGSENEDKKYDSRYRNQRYRVGDKIESPLMRKGIKIEERFPTPVLKMSKHQRRKLFALQVEAKEEEHRRNQQELWREHEKQCMMLGTDPRFTAPFDPTRGYQCIWNPQVGQWQNYPIPPQNQTVLFSTIPSLPNTSVPPPQIPTPLPQIPTNIPPPQIHPQMSTNIHPPLPPNSIHPPLPTNMPPPQIATSVPSYQYPTQPLQNLQLGGMQSMQNIQQMQMQPLHQPISVQQVSQIQAQNIQISMQNVQQALQTIQMQPGYSVPQIQPPLPPLPAQPIPYQEKPKVEEKDDITTVRFAGPIPPPVKLPPKWKCAKDKYGRPYYYHIKIRKSQWEPPTFPEPQEEPEESSESSSSSDSSTVSSDSSSDDSDSDDMDDAKLLMEVRKQMEMQAKLAFKGNDSNQEDDESLSPYDEPKSNNEDDDIDEIIHRRVPEVEGESSIDRRLKEQFNLLTDEPPASKKRRTGLVEEIIISPRTEQDRLQFKQDLKMYKKNKEDLKRQKEVIVQQARKKAKEQAAKENVKEKLSKAIMKSKLKEMTHDNSDKGKRIKETFRSSMANVVVGMLNAYRKPDCKEGRITNTEDFKHLARKLTHFVMLKEMKHIARIEELICTENVKSKAREYIKKYMAKYGEIYQKRDDEPDF